MSIPNLSPASRPLRPPISVPVAVTAECQFAPVYAIRSPEDLATVQAMTSPRSRDPMGTYFVGQGVITTEDLREALTIQRNSANRRLGWILCRLGHLDELTLGRLLATHFGVPCVTLEHYRPGGDYRQRLPENIAGDGDVAVIHEEESHAWIAVSDVTNQSVKIDAAAWLRKAISPVMAGREEVIRFLRAGEPTAAEGQERALEP